MFKRPFAFVAALAVVTAVMGAAVAGAAEEVVVPTTATINKGKLIDEYPGPPPPGTTDLAFPFYGQISTGHPACRIRRTYELGQIEPDGEFTWVGRTTAPTSGRWTFGLAGKPPEPMVIAVRALPRKVEYEGAAYLCQEAISSTVTFDNSDFTPCLVARAEQRGYGPAIRNTKRYIRKAESRNDEEAIRIYREQLREFRSYRDSIRRAVQNRC